MSAKSIMLAATDKATVPFDESKRRLNAKGEQIGVEVNAQHDGVFKFTHRV